MIIFSFIKSFVQFLLIDLNFKIRFIFIIDFYTSSLWDWYLLDELSQILFYFTDHLAIFLVLKCRRVDFLIFLRFGQLLLCIIFYAYTHPSDNLITIVFRILVYFVTVFINVFISAFWFRNLLGKLLLVIFMLKILLFCKRWKVMNILWMLLLTLLMIKWFLFCTLLCGCNLMITLEITSLICR